MKFAKIHGLGNDFVIVNHQELPHDDYKTLAIRVCDRHFGIGADGLILVFPSETADFKMRIFNIDGSEAEMCGNGIRCFAKYLYEHELTHENKITIETLAGIIIPHLIINNGKVDQVRVDMGEPRLKRSEIPAIGNEERVVDEPLEVKEQIYRITGVSMGNPHCITFVDHVDDIVLDTIGPMIETHSFFPQKTNVEFIEVVDRDEIKMRVWERGSGITLACGTGACASVVACILNEKTERKVKVHLPGGDLLIEWAENNHVYMTGPATEVFVGEYNIIDN